MQSSYATFLEGGFNYTVPVHDNIQSVLQLSSDDITNGKLWGASGTFNLPICDPSGKWSIDTFYDNIHYTSYYMVAPYVIFGCLSLVWMSGVANLVVGSADATASKTRTARLSKMCTVIGLRVVRAVRCRNAA